MSPMSPISPISPIRPIIPIFPIIPIIPITSKRICISGIEFIPLQHHNYTSPTLFY